jgi:hypothetical protein
VARRTSRSHGPDRSDACPCVGEASLDSCAASVWFRVGALDLRSSASGRDQLRIGPPVGERANGHLPRGPRKESARECDHDCGASQQAWANALNCAPCRPATPSVTPGRCAFRNAHLTGLIEVLEVIRQRCGPAGDTAEMPCARSGSLLWPELWRVSCWVANPVAMIASGIDAF